MDITPFKRLTRRRAIRRPELPRNVTEFYAKHEGVGLESSQKRAIRLCKLSEIEHVGCRDIMSLGPDVSGGWENFEGLRLGTTSCFDDVVYVTSAPVCK